MNYNFEKKNPWKIVYIQGSQSKTSYTLTENSLKIQFQFEKKKSLKNRKILAEK